MEMTAINPVGVMGPILGKDFSHSNQTVRQMLSGEMRRVPKLSSGYVDVRDVEEEDGEITVYADQDQFHAVQTALNEMGITEFEVAELTMLPTSTVELEGDALAKFLKLLDVLEDLDDVQQVHHNVELPEEEE